MLRNASRTSGAVRSGLSAWASSAGNSVADGLHSHDLSGLRCKQSVDVASNAALLRTISTGSHCGTALRPPTADWSCAAPSQSAVSAAEGLGRRHLHSQRTALDGTSEDTPNSVAAALAARPPPPPLPYDSDEDSTTGAGEAPFVPPQIDKLMKMIMRHGKKEQARRIVFDATHAMYNNARAKNPRPELRQRHKDFAS